jgi:hypothetical protein
MNKTQSKQFAKKVHGLINTQIRSHLKKSTAEQLNFFNTIKQKGQQLHPSATNLICTDEEFKIHSNAQLPILKTRSQTPLSTLDKVLNSFIWATNFNFCHKWIATEKCTLKDYINTFIKNILPEQSNLNFKAAEALLYTYFINRAIEKYPELLIGSQSEPELQFIKRPIVLPNWDEYRRRHQKSRAKY